MFAFLTGSGLSPSPFPPLICSFFIATVSHVEINWIPYIWTNSLHVLLFLSRVGLISQMVNIFLKDFQTVLHRSRDNSYLESTLYWLWLVHSINYNVHLNYPKSLLKWKFWFSRARLVWNSAFLTAPWFCRPHWVMRHLSHLLVMPVS